VAGQQWVFLVFAHSAERKEKECGISIERAKEGYLYSTHSFVPRRNISGRTTAILLPSGAFCSHTRNPGSAPLRNILLEGATT
jgi:hypothetical protein